MDGFGFVGSWVPAEDRWSKAGVHVQLLDGGECRGDDACKVLGGRWEATSAEQARVEMGPTSGLYCDFRFPLVDLLEQPLQLTSDGETLILAAAGVEPVELVRGLPPGSEGNLDESPGSGSSPGAFPANADTSGVIAVTADDGTAAFVLVAEAANDEEALLTGAVEVLDGCLGVAGSVVLWPPGTLVMSADPLTVGVPGFGVASVGDMLALSGGFDVASTSSGERTARDLRTPAGCGGRVVFHSGTATEAERR